ncbi:hypothetical protein BJX63DRAFT_395420 [Aspergillus granulosus]|uniref:Zn(2)-C6 fungal-type domain-containing protein n=1 Tax=Aspergillus granulosus TaxID=176169 RepID=A0ABR4HCW0_9EURO
MPANNPTATAQEYTAEACFSCRIKKRKCDKQIPACSRCRRVDQQCLYGMSAGGVYGTIVPFTDNKLCNPSSNHVSPKLERASPPLVGWGSCRQCYKLKKRCDKAYPSCSRCKRLDAPCAYERLQRLRLFSSQHLLSFELPPMNIIALKPSYPVESRPYIPALVQSFQERMGLSALPVEIDSLAYYMRCSWIQRALVDPCLFHATLYAASAQLDTLRATTAAGMATPNPVTLYHQTEAIIAVNSRIVSSKVLDDATIAAVLLLVITGSLQNDDQATEVHRLGLTQMVAMRGGLKALGFDGVLSRMVQMNMVLPAVVFDQLDAFLVDGICLPAASSNLPGWALEKLGHGTSGNPSVRFHMTAIFAHVWELLLAVDCGEDENGEYQFDFATGQFILDGEWPRSESLPLDLSKSEAAMVKACQVALRILRYLLDDRLPPPQRTEMLVAMVEELKSHISSSDPESWLQYAPHASLWVTTLGLAVSDDVQGRLWFLMHERCVVMSIKDTQPAPHEMVWACYRWMRQLIHVRSVAWTGSV